MPTHAHRLERAAVDALVDDPVASASLLSELALAPDAAGYGPVALLLSSGGRGRLASLLAARGVPGARTKARYLWTLCEEFAEGRLRFGS